MNQAIGETKSSEYAEDGWAQRGSYEERIDQVAVPVAESERVGRQPKPDMVGNKGLQDKAKETDGGEAIAK